MGGEELMGIGTLLMQIGSALIAFGLIILFAVISVFIIIGVVFIAERLNDE